jgi:hypothetical protein
LGNHPGGQPEDVSDLERPDDDEEAGEGPVDDDATDPDAADPDEIVRRATGNPDAEPGLGRVPSSSD